PRAARGRAQDDGTAGKAAPAARPRRDPRGREGRSRRVRSPADRRPGDVRRAPPLSRRYRARRREREHRRQGRRAHRKPPRQAPDAPMTLEGVFPDLLAPLPSVAAVEAELARSLRRLVAHARAVAGALGFTPPGDAPVVVTAGRGRLPGEHRAGLPASGWGTVGRRALPRGVPPGAAPGRPVRLETPAVRSGGRRGGALSPRPP